MFSATQTWFATVIHFIWPGWAISWLETITLHTKLAINNNFTLAKLASDCDSWSKLDVIHLKFSSPHLVFDQYY